MNENYSIYDDTIIVLGLVVLAFIILLLIIGFIINNIIPFLEDRKCIKLEMERSLSDEEYFYWKSELRSLYLSSIPLIGRFFR